MNKLFILIAVLIVFCCFKDKIPGLSKFTRLSSFSSDKSKFTAVTCDESVICNQE
jgi:hypothetical protein